jgi:hypothetical protein
MWKKPRVKLIDSSNSPNSALQILGFIMIVAGTLYLLIKVFLPSQISFASFSGETVSIVFFIIMLGVSFAFPQLLQDYTRGLSTMRITVFMMTNVICMLLLKAGWSAAGLEDVKINPYLAGIIAFIFGSKATQSYFESKLAVPQSTAPDTAQLERDAILQAAKEQLLSTPGNRIELPANIATGKIKVFVTDPNTKVPDKLTYTYGVQKTIGVEKQKSNAVQTMAATLAPCDQIANHFPFAAGNKGSVGCTVQKKASATSFLLTCYHVVKSSTQSWDHFDSTLGGIDVVHPIGGQIIGTVSEAYRTDYLDSALVRLSNGSTSGNTIPGVGAVTKSRKVVADDVKAGTNVKLFSGMRSSIRGGYISDINQKVWILYAQDLTKPEEKLYHLLDGLILIKPLDKDPFSIGGDSGSVIVDELGFAIGLLVAGTTGADSVSYAIPIDTIFSQLNLKL